MSDGNDLPQVEPQQTSSCPMSGGCAVSKFLRTLIYVPVILGVTGLAALAMFPSLADHIGSADGNSTGSSCSSGGNPNCPIQMLIKSFSTPAKNEVLSPACSSDLSAMNDAFNCCPTSRCHAGKFMESKASEEVTTEVQSAEEQPADALAAVLNAQQLPEAQEKSTNN